MEYWYAFNDQEIKKRVLQKEGIYWIRLRSEKKIIYIGRSYEGQNIQARLLHHLKTDDNHKLRNYVDTKKDDLEFNFEIAGEESLLQPPQAELFQIHYIKPECNIQGKDRDLLPASLDKLIDLIQGKG